MVDKSDKRKEKGKARQIKNRGRLKVSRSCWGRTDDVLDLLSQFCLYAGFEGFLIIFFQLM